MLVRVSHEFKNQCKKDVSSLKYGTLHIKEDNKDITESDNLKDFKIAASCYVKDKFIGTTVAKKITGNILNDGQYNLEDKNIQVKTGIKIEENVEYQSLDTYIIPKPNPEEVKQKTQFTGYDYMIKFDIPYVDRVTYPIRLDNYLEDLCNQVKVVLGSKDFFNNDYMILGNPFTNNETCKVVLSNICQLALGFAVIEEEKLYIRNLDVNGESVETIDGNNYMDFSPNNVFGPVNSFKIQMNSGVEGEESVREEAGVTDGNRCQISISDNYFLNSQEQRELVIDKMFNAIKGLTYLPVKINYYGYPWLKLGDKIKVLNNNDKEYVTYVMEHVFEYNGSYNGTVESKAITKTQSTYKNTQNIKEWKRKTESAVDKINGKITQIVQETTQNSDKITEHEQTIDSIKNTVNAIIDVTNTVEGSKTISLGNCVKGDLLELHIYGNNTVFDYLRLSDNLILSDDLKLYGDSKITVTDKDNNSRTYDLGIKEVLRQNGNIYDEYILKDGKAQIIRRINKDGAIKTTEEIEDLGEFSITLEEGTNIITIENYIARIMVKWILKNEFTDVYATRVELGSSIKQLAGEIKLEATKKVDKSEFGTMIGQNWEAIKFAWNQISQYLKMEGIEGKATLNIYGENNNMLMSLSQDGQAFYDSMGNKIGTVGIVREENKDTLAFAMNVDWDSVSESKSMAWGYFDKNGKFLPIFHLVGTYGAENSEYGGELAVEGRLSTESLKVIKNTIESGETTLNLIDTYGNTLLTMDSSTQFFNLLGLISCFTNELGEKTIDFANCTLVNMKNIPRTDNISMISGHSGDYGFLHANLKDGSYVVIYANNSDKRLKKNIKKTSKIALDKIKKIKHREFNWKVNDKHQDIGYIAQEMKEIDESFVHHTKYKDQNGLEKEDWQINTLSVLATATKAIQEQQIEIENLQKSNIEKDKLINNLMARIERLEGKINGI